MFGIVYTNEGFRKKDLSNIRFILQALNVADELAKNTTQAELLDVPCTGKINFGADI